jgi:hypothetical protein
MVARATMPAQRLPAPALRGVMTVQAHAAARRGLSWACWLSCRALLPGLFAWRLLCGVPALLAWVPMGVGGYCRLCLPCARVAAGLHRCCACACWRAVHAATPELLLSSTVRWAGQSKLTTPVYHQPGAVFLQLHGGARNHASTAAACTSFAGGDDGAGTCCRRRGVVLSMLAVLQGALAWLVCMAPPMQEPYCAGMRSGLFYRPWMASLAHQLVFTACNTR